MQSRKVDINPRLVFRITRRIYLQKWKLFFIGIGLAGALMILLASLTSEDATFRAVVAGIGMGVIAMPLALLLRIRMNIFSEKNAHFREPVTYHLDENLIRWVRDDGSESSWRWDKIEKLERYENYILLFPTGNAFLYIPNDCFESEEAQEFFEDRLEEIENR